MQRNKSCNHFSHILRGLYSCKKQVVKALFALEGFSFQASEYYCLGPPLFFSLSHSVSAILQLLGKLEIFVLVFQC